MVGPTRLHLSLHVQRQLPSQKQILSDELRVRLPAGRDKSQQVTSEAESGAQRRSGHGSRWYAIHRVDNRTVDLAGWIFCGAQDSRSQHALA
jgi:hypothetical protein